MTLAITNGAVLLMAVLALALPALMIRYQHPDSLRWMRPKGPFLWDLIASELGASISYTTPPYTPGATALTAAQAKQTPTQIAQITFADGDTSQVFTHNWGLPSSFPSWTLPEISYYWLSQNASPTSFGTALTFGITNTNSVQVNKTSVGVGSGGVVAVILRRGDGPWA